eukprot:jgi/Galph1/85/GphlegSOOS_G4871.1
MRKPCVVFSNACSETRPLVGQSDIVSSHSLACPDNTGNSLKVKKRCLEKNTVLQHVSQQIECVLTREKEETASELLDKLIWDPRKKEPNEIPLLKTKRKPRGYWKQFECIRKEILQYVEQRDGQVGLMTAPIERIRLHRMPTANELRKVGRQDIALAISSYHDGYHQLADNIGLHCCYHQIGYWDRFENVAKELAQITQSNWEMPTYGQLLKLRRSDLAKAINKHGGFPAVARALGRKMIKPRKQWANIQQLSNHLQQFMAQNGLEELPTISVLRSAKRWDLIGAIRLHGGLHQVAEKVNLMPSKNTRRRRGHWLDIDTLKREILTFMQSQTSFPTQTDLKTNGRQDLLEAIRKHGGMHLVASKLGFELKRKPKGYWKDFLSLRAEISVFIRRYGTPGVMPHGQELVLHRRHDLIYAINLHGGSSVVAGKLHLVWIGPLSFWQNFNNLRKRLLADKEKWDYQGMPTWNDLLLRGRVDLAFGIRLHQGFPTVAKALQLELVYPSRPRLYWTETENVITELKETIALLSNYEKQFMPSCETLYQLGRGDLADAVRDTKGWIYYAKRLKLKPNYPRVSKGFWKDWHHVRVALQRYLTHRGLPLQAMPSTEELYRDGRSDLAFAITKYHQGATKMAHRCQWKAPHLRPLPSGYYQYWSNVVKQLVCWVDKFGVRGLMPSKHDLYRTGYRDLIFVIYRHGGFDKVARRLGWIIYEDNPGWLTQWLAHQAGYSMIKKPKRMRPFAKWMAFPD